VLFSLFVLEHCLLYLCSILGLWIEQTVLFHGVMKCFMLVWNLLWVWQTYTVKFQGQDPHLWLSKLTNAVIPERGWVKYPQSTFASVFCISETVKLALKINEEQKNSQFNIFHFLRHNLQKTRVYANPKIYNDLLILLPNLTESAKK